MSALTETDFCLVIRSLAPNAMQGRAITRNDRLADIGIDSMMLLVAIMKMIQQYELDVAHLRKSSVSPATVGEVLELLNKLPQRCN